MMVAMDDVSGSKQPQPERGEFALVFEGKLTARPFAHVCPRCPRKSARRFFCTVCNVHSISAGVARLNGVAA